jgi:YHS domain-containing protein
MKLVLATSAFLLLFAACQSGEAPKKEATTTEATSIKFDNTKDPVCGMDVSPSYTDTCHHEGKVYGFCSEHCKESFQADPASYMDKLN